VPKLEYLAADAIARGCDTLFSIGGVQSNHTRADHRPGQSESPNAVRRVATKPACRRTSALG